MKRQSNVNSVTLIQFEGGDVVKQGDISSVFGFQFVDENKKSINLDGEKATVRFVTKDYRIVYETTATVENDKVLFTIDQPIEIGQHRVEIWAGGYVFPSNDEVRIVVTRSSNEYTEVELINERELLEDIKKRFDELSNVNENKAEKEVQEIPDLLMFYNIAKI